MITFEEWLDLTPEEKSEKYKDLNDADKFKARQGDYFSSNKKEEVTLEQIEELLKEIEQNNCI